MDCEQTTEDLNALANWYYRKDYQDLAPEERSRIESECARMNSVLRSGKRLREVWNKETNNASLQAQN